MKKDFGVIDHQRGWEHMTSSRSRWVEDERLGRRKERNAEVCGATTTGRLRHQGLHRPHRLHRVPPTNTNPYVRPTRPTVRHVPLPRWTCHYHPCICWHSFGWHRSTSKCKRKYAVVGIFGMWQSFLQHKCSPDSSMMVIFIFTIIFSIKMRGGPL